MDTGCDGRKAGELTADDITRLFTRGVDEISAALSSGSEDRVKETLAEQGGVLAGLACDALIKFTKLCDDVWVLRADSEHRADAERAAKTGQEPPLRPIPPTLMNP